MQKRTALITGVAGAIGHTIYRHLQRCGWRVVGTDCYELAPAGIVDYVCVDLNQLCLDELYRKQCLQALDEKLGGGMHLLVNNAALQVLARCEDMSLTAWQTTQNVNVLAPFILIQHFLAALESSRGSVVNIASIHAHLTKPSFSAYATSKAALLGMTRSLAVEIGARVRVNAICPAAIDTPMLHAGFADNSADLGTLRAYHPSGSIGSPQEVAEAVLYCAKAGNFLNGSEIGLNGGIGARLHDPV